MSASSKEIGRLIHDKIAQDAAAASLLAGMLAIELERSASPHAADAVKLQAVLDKLAKDVHDVLKELRY